MKHEEVYLNGYACVLKVQMGLEDYFRFYDGPRPQRALSYRTPAEVLYGDQDVVKRGSNQRRCSMVQENISLAGQPGFSLGSALILSK